MEHLKILNLLNEANDSNFVTRKHCVRFTKCITKIDGTTIYEAEDLDLVMTMYNLMEYSSDYSEITGSL